MGDCLELKQYWNLVLKNLTTVLVLSFLGGSLGLMVSFASPKIYKAESQIFISTPTPAVDIGAMQQGSSFSQQRVISYSRVISGPATLVPVIEKLGLKMSATELAGKISSSAPIGTVLINITVSDVSPIRTAAIANAVAVQFGETIKSLELPQFGDSAGVKATMVRAAEVPQSPASPNKKLNLLTGILFGFVIACLIGVVRQIFDSSVKNANHLSGHQLLSTVFYDPDAAENPLVTSIGTYSLRAEAFRHLRTSLAVPFSQNNCQVLAVTSAFPGEGKTTTSINLAISFAQTGLKVALVEADLRRPTFKKYFNDNDKSQIGLTELLSLIEKGKTPRNFQKYFKTFGGDQDCFEWLGSGALTSNPSEKLGSSAMSVLIDGLRREYDIVIIDTPPALPVTDAAVVSITVDGVLVVAKAGVTRQSHLSGVFEILENLNSKIFGVVLNMIPVNTRGEEYGYAYNRYEPKSKYGYNYGHGYGYGASEPYGPLVLQSNLPATGQVRVPLEVRIKAKLANRKKVRAHKALEVAAPEVKSSPLVSEFDKLLAEMDKKYS
jgi:succinoglycan biosynthesis transport protein ExoP